MKNKGKVLLAIITSFLLCLSAMPVLAAENEKRYVDNTAVLDANEYEQILDAVGGSDMVKRNNEERNMRSVGNGQLGEGYKLYFMSAPDFAKGVIAGKSVSEAISSDYVWDVPNEAEQVFRIRVIDGQWKVIGYSTPLAGEKDPSIIDLDLVDAAIAELAKSYDVSDIQVQCFLADMYFANFVYITTPDNEYLIPFAARPDFTGLENGRLYTALEASQILVENFPLIEGEMNGSTDNNGGAGGMNTTDNPATGRTEPSGWTLASYIMIAVAGSLIIIE